MRRVVSVSYGFTYIGLLIAIAIAGALLAVVGTLWSTDARREREKDLLFVGDQFRLAIGSYFAESPAGQPHKFPAKLEDLLTDKRWPTTRRHLRKIFVDPMTNTHDWMFVRAADQTIIGVYSASEDVPLKHANFADDYANFEGAKTYRDWQFVWKQNPARGTPAPNEPRNPATPALPQPATPGGVPGPGAVAKP